MPPTPSLMCYRPEPGISESAFSLNYCRAWGEPAGRADFRTVTDDFIVDERFELPLSGDGDHIYLLIRKRNQNTRWLVSRLAKIFDVLEKDIGYCGLKDRRALTTQWFSVRQPDQGFDHFKLDSQSGSPLLPECEVLRVTRHRRKLRRGMHSGNVFKIRLRNFQGDIGLAERRLEAIAEQGVPNYFGEQRFGIQGGNLAAADHILTQSISSKGRDDKWGLYISAARSHLFNRVLSMRVEQGTWATPLEGEATPSGPLWGRGRTVAGEQLAAFEDTVLAGHSSWRQGLEHCGLKQERRDLILAPEAMHWQWQEGDLCLQFGLPPGTYATSVLREMVLTNVPVCTAML
jgi:tRNA pseudouridine13 synthase